MVKRIDKLTEAQRARFDEWADRWIEVGLRTDPADRPKFEAAVRQCYEFADIPWHGNVIWVSSPMVMSIAGPVAALVLELHKQHGKRSLAVAVRDAVRGAVSDAVSGAVGDAVHGAVRGAVSDAVSDAVRGAVGDAVRGAVDDTVRDAVSDAVRGAVSGAVSDAVGQDATAIRQAVGEVIRRSLGNWFGGQFWVGGWWWGGAFTSFFREVCSLELSGDLWKRGRAYEATLESACWWYPHKDFIMVCERPTYIQRELADPARARGWGSHRLHNATGAAIKWPDGWGVYAIHGVRVPGWIIEHPELVTVAKIESERNAEVRRIMIERYGQARFLRDSGAEIVNRDECGLLYRKEVTEDEPIVMVRVLNPTPEPDGTLTEAEARSIFGDAVVDANLSAMVRIGFAAKFKRPRFKEYMLRVPPVMKTAREAVAWTFDVPVKSWAPELQT